MFGIVDRLLLRGPSHVERAGELRRVYATITDDAGGQRTTATHPYALYTTLRDNTRSFSAVAAYRPLPMRVGDGLQARRVSASYATAGFWPLLGVHPEYGRFFMPDEDRLPRGRDVAVIGYGFWQRNFGSDPRVVGRAIRVNGRPRTIVGVAPRGFTGAEWSAVDLWVPMSSEDRPRGWESSWDANSARIFGRLMPGVRDSAASAEATELHHRFYNGVNPASGQAAIIARPLFFGEQGNEPPELAVARLLLGVAVAVLLIAAANAANLFLARGIRQGREITIRLALGATRGRLVRMLFSEAAILALLGGGVGVVVAYWGGELARNALFPTVAWNGAPIDGHVLLYMVVAVLTTTVIIGIAPAFRLSASPVGVVHVSGSVPSGVTGGADHRRSRWALQIAQVALSTMLLVVAGLFVRSLAAVEGQDLGVRPEHVVTASIAMPRRDSAATTRTEWLELLKHIRSLPGVGHAAVAIGAPFGNRAQITLRASGRDSIFGLQESGPFIYAVTPGYFETVRTPILRGRAFSAIDRAGSERVAIVNATMARWIWPQQDPLGQCLYLGGMAGAPCSRVVGVVADAHISKIREDPVMQYYVPFGQEIGIGGNVLLVRVAETYSVETFLPTLRSALRDAAPGATTMNVETLASRIDPQTRPWRIGARMFGLFGCVSLLVAAVGLFSVVWYVVSQRRRELGVRIALGASASRVLTLVLRGALATTAVGAVIGAAIAYALAPLIEPHLFETAARDAPTFGAAIVAVTVAALAASIAPGVRACRVDPAIVLRTE